MEFPGHGGRLLGRLRQQRELGFLCDCTVLVGDARFPAHRAVLAACSVYFHLFYRDRPSGSRGAVRLNGDVVTAPAFGRLLDFMYEGRLDLRGLPAEDVLAAASYLHMYDVVRVCQARLRRDRDRGRAPLPQPPAPGPEQGSQPPGPPPARPPELCPVVQRAGPPAAGAKVALPTAARRPPSWQTPGESDGALDLSLKPGQSRAPVNPPRALQTPPCPQTQQGARPLVKAERDALSERGDVGPLQPPRAPAARRPARSSEPLPLGGAGGREPNPGVGHEATEDAPALGGRVCPCPCPLCGGLFPSAHVLQLHLSAHFRERDGARTRLSPDGASPTCPLCGKTFSCAYTLKRHERTHSGEKPYACAQCGKSFQYSHNLSRHAVVHTREKPHACRWCERRFTQSGDLYRHVRKFHCGLV